MRAPHSSTHSFARPTSSFMYDMSPIVVTVNARPPSILHYLVRISAVVGGCVAITRGWCVCVCVCARACAGGKVGAWVTSVDGDL